MDKKILLVEDDEDMAFLLQLELEEAGFIATLATDGSHALDILVDQTFDGILSDLYMPNIDGLQLVQALRAKSINTKTIIISGSTNESIALKLQENGIKHIFVKPLTDEDMNTIFSIFSSE